MMARMFRISSTASHQRSNAPAMTRFIMRAAARRISLNMSCSSIQVLHALAMSRFMNFLRIMALRCAVMPFISASRSAARFSSMSSYHLPHVAASWRFIIFLAHRANNTFISLASSVISAQRSNAPESCRFMSLASTRAIFTFISMASSVNSIHLSYAPDNARFMIFCAHRLSSTRISLASCVISVQVVNAPAICRLTKRPSTRFIFSFISSASSVISHQRLNDAASPRFFIFWIALRHMRANSQLSTHTSKFC
mmetsp:Transcript_16415/g.40153  ORF Transcript_16415/g.40153 Transcript_16415/m.40153 type:complete len:254 (-) Transcript_16415:556-1317(-)